MSISVVICAYTLGRWDDLCAAVQSCHEQTLRAEDVILVVDFNDELFQRATDAFAGTRVLVNASSRGLSGARNTGISASSSDLIAFLDDDAFAEPQWLEQLTAPFSDPAVAGVGGWIVPNWPTTAPTWFPETFYWVLGCSYSGLPGDNKSIRNPIGANMVMRRHVFESVGGFTAGIGRIGRNPLGCEETELCIRYAKQAPGERFVIRHDAIVHHRVPAERITWDYFWRRCWAEGLSKAAVSSLVGADAGLVSERRHVLQTMPIEIARSTAALVKSPRPAATRIVLIGAGSLLALAGLLRGRFVLRNTPIQTQGNTKGFPQKSQGDRS